MSKIEDEDCAEADASPARRGGRAEAAAFVEVSNSERSEL